MDEMDTCPCGSQRAYGRCCQPIHTEGAGFGTTAEQLMRARYSAYVLHDDTFLLATWHPATRPEHITFTDDVKWHELLVVETTRGAALDDSGTVEFKARFERNSERLELHETSHFERQNGNWVYTSGE